MTLPIVDNLPFDPPYPAGTPKFQPGQTVRTRPGAAPGHIRTPWYLRGKTGMVERICGAFGNPEALAYGLGTGDLPLYRVRFTMVEVWGDGVENPQDTIDAEIFEHWLEAA
ncbi:MAG: SH3-like domain-containing protein [Pseudomonadota bacterium]